MTDLTNTEEERFWAAVRVENAVLTDRAEYLWMGDVSHLTNPIDDAISVRDEW